MDFEAVRTACDAVTDEILAWFPPGRPSSEAMPMVAAVVGEVLGRADAVVEGMRQYGRTAGARELRSITFDVVWLFFRHARAKGADLRAAPHDLLCWDARDRSTCFARDGEADIERTLRENFQRDCYMYNRERGCAPLLAGEPEPDVVHVDVRDGEDLIDAMLLAMVRTQMARAFAPSNAQPPIDVDVRLGEPAPPQ